MKRLLAIGASLLATTLLSACAVAGATAGAAISVTGAVVATGVSLTGRAIGAGIDALSSEPEPPDHSGIVIRERVRDDVQPGGLACADDSACH